MAFNDVKAGLLGKELLDQMIGLRVRDGACSSDAIFAERDTCFNFRNFGDKGRSMSKQGRCYYFKESYHWKSECPSLKKKEVAMSSSIAMEDDMRISDDVLTTMVSQVSDQDWILDSGASFHIMPNMNCFSSYVRKEEGEILISNDAACKPLDIGLV